MAVSISGNTVTNGLVQFGQPYLLDAYTGAAAAYSLRKLRTTYYGSAIRVRRSSDNAEQDIGFVNGALDETSLLSFTGANSGYVTKWYDQSGNGRDAAQSTAANQPRIVNAGVVYKQNNKPILYLNGTSNYLSISNFAFSSYSNLSIFSSNIPSGSGGRFLINQGDYSSLNNFSFGIKYNVGIEGLSSSNGALSSSTFNLIITNNNTPSTFHLLYYQFLGSNSAASKQLFYLNGSQLATTLSGTYNGNISSLYNSSAQILLFCENRSGYSYFYNGNVSEIILYNSNQSTSRTAIESNINTYYKIY